MVEQERHLRIKVGFPFIVSLETDDVLSLFRRRRTSRGPFLLVVRGRGLALDTAFHMEGENPIVWPAHALPHQLWYFHRTEHDGQFEIVSVANGLALDAQTGRDTPRQAVMWTRHGQSHQRWRLHPTDDGAACFIQSVRTGHVLDVPWEAGYETRTAPVLIEMHGGENQQFVIATPSRGPG
ncbi:MAG TPA: RICIN domain-containing protein [Streptosporangiaceae bacterium]|nr:RICIN domain-containing protein [Streptosporangiaceae bacterium]